VPSSQAKTDFVARVANLAIRESRKHKLGIPFAFDVPANEIPDGFKPEDIRGLVEIKVSRSGLVTMGSSGWTYRFFKQ